MHVTRTSVSTSLYSDATIAAAELLGWNRQAPDSLSPGRIELLTRDCRAVVNFSPLQTAEFQAIDTRLMNLQAGYPLDRGLPGGDGGVAERASATAGDSDAEAAPHGTNHGSSSTSGAVTGDEWHAAGDAEGSPQRNPHSGGRAERSANGDRKRPPAPWQAVATPDEVPEANPEADIDNPIYGQHVTVTGDVEPYDKGQVWTMIAQAGGTVGKNVTKKTTMLIVGQWATTTSKEKRARELRDKGQDIEIVSFDEFLGFVGEK